MQINLQFSEREYLRGKASEIRFSEQKTKFPLRFLFPPSLHSTPRPQQGGAGGGSYILDDLMFFPKIIVPLHR